MPNPIHKTYIKCQGCGKEIEQKVNRVLCIKCSNKRDRDRERERRKARLGFVG